MSTGQVLECIQGRYRHRGRTGAIALACLGFSTAAFADRKCSGTIVKGNVLVYSGSRLTTLGAQIEGNIQAKDAISVTVHPKPFFPGDIQLENLSGPSKVTYS